MLLFMLGDWKRCCVVCVVCIILPLHEMVCVGRILSPCTCVLLFALMFESLY